LPLKKLLDSKHGLKKWFFFVKPIVVGKVSANTKIRNILKCLWHECKKAILPSEIYRVSSAPIDAEKLRLGMKVQRGKKLFQKRTKTKKSNLPHPKLIDHGAHPKHSSAPYLTKHNKSHKKKNDSQLSFCLSKIQFWTLPIHSTSTFRYNWCDFLNTISAYLSR